MPRINTGNLHINYELEGKGKTVVFINGITMDINGWGYQAPFFSRYYQVLRYDCRGQGLSDKPSTTYTQQIHATDLKDLIDKLQLGNVSIVGLSNGGMIAQHFALLFPELVDRLVLVDTCCYVDNLLSLMIDIWIKATELGGNDFRYDVTVPFVFSNEFITNNAENISKMKDNSVKINDPSAVINLALACKTHNLHKEVSRIKFPTLIVVGEEDILIPPRHSELLHKLISDSKFITIENCGHVPSIEKPERFNKIVIDFLNGSG